METLYNQFVNPSPPACKGQGANTNQNQLGFHDVSGAEGAGARAALMDARVRARRVGAGRLRPHGTRRAPPLIPCGMRASRVPGLGVSRGREGAAPMHSRVPSSALAQTRPLSLATHPHPRRRR